MSIVIPEWFKIANPKSGVESKEVASILGVHTNKLFKEVYAGKFPKPDYQLATGKPNQRNRWRVSTLRKEFAQRGVLN